MKLKIKFDQDYLKLIKDFERVYPEALDNVVRNVSSDAELKVKEATPVDLGQAKRGWDLKKVGMYHYQLENNVSYINHLEFGTKNSRYIKKLAKTIKVKGIKAYRMMRDVMPWVAEQMPIRVKERVEQLWINAFGKRR